MIEFKLNFKHEMEKLRKDEDNFEFFRTFALYCLKRDPEYFKIIFDELLNFSQENNLIKTKAWVHYYVGWYYFDKTQYEKSTDSFLLSNNFFEEINDKKGIIFACNGLTNVYFQMGQFNLANEWGIKGISICEETNESEIIVILLMNTGINYIQMNYFQNAKDIFNNINIMYSELTKEQQISYNLAVAEIEINIGEAQKALKYVDEAIKIEKELFSDFNFGEIYKIKGIAYMKLNDYVKAEEQFNISLSYSDKIDNIYEKCSTMLKLAKLFIVTDRKVDAVKLLQEVSEISRDKNLKVLLRESYHLLYEIYKDLKNCKESLFYLEKYISIDDQIYDYEQNQLMAKMNLKHTKGEAKLYKNLYDKTELLSSIGQKIISNLDIKLIVEIINKEINKLFNCDCFGVAVYDSEKNEAVYQMVSENSEVQEMTFNILDDDISFVSYCIKNKTDILISNADKEYGKYEIDCPRCLMMCKNQKSIIFTPMIIKDKVVGLMSVLSNSKNAYDKSDLNTLKILANYSAIAIDNAISYKKIEIKAIYDHMTGFLTRYEVLRLGQILYEKYKDNNNEFSIIMIDIDDFKLINDTYGHCCGDKALSLITQTISKCIRATDYIGRYGGDEFLMICPGAKQKEAFDVAERIRKAIYDKNFAIADETTVNITLSLGVYEFRSSDKSFSDGIKMADKHLYNAKKNDKNKVVSI